VHRNRYPCQCHFLRLHCEFPYVIPGIQPKVLYTPKSSAMIHLFLATRGDQG
jgi:hypothetical protein